MHNKIATSELLELKARIGELYKGLHALQQGISRLTPERSPYGSRVIVASVDKDKCVGCGACESVCPAGAIRVDDVANVDVALCMGCGACVEACKKGAISLSGYYGHNNMGRMQNTLRPRGYYRGRGAHRHMYPRSRRR